MKTMGAKHSGPETSNEEATLDNDGIVENTSGGFHVVEIHAPTVGVGIGMVLFVIFAAALALYCLRRFKRHLQVQDHRRQRRPHRRVREGQGLGAPPFYTSRIVALDEEEAFEMATLVRVHQPVATPRQQHVFGAGQSRCLEGSSCRDAERVPAKEAAKENQYEEREDY